MPKCTAFQLRPTGPSGRAIRYRRAVILSQAPETVPGNYTHHERSFFWALSFQFWQMQGLHRKQDQSSVVGGHLRRPIAFAISSSSRERALGRPSVRVHRGYDCTYYLRFPPKRPPGNLTSLVARGRGWPVTRDELRALSRHKTDRYAPPLTAP
jgi:hypothetical protein